MKLTGQRCQCPDCREYFNSVAAFDRHRDGSHKKQTRHCVDPAKLGMSRNAAGFWITAPKPVRPAYITGPVAFTSPQGRTISPGQGSGQGRGETGGKVGVLG